MSQQDIIDALKRKQPKTLAELAKETGINRVNVYINICRLVKSNTVVVTARKNKFLYKLKK